ncbi:MAG TPA: hypothetical protein VGB08_05970 [Allosphingosinicella sp.]|jgi:hypothetical protein
MTGDQIKFHSQRAAAELDLAMRAGHVAAARAHFGLSQLHLQRLERLAAEPAAADPVPNEHAP